MILLTGWSGFIGSHIREMLDAEKYQHRLFRGDITNPEDVERNLRDVETVIHLAAVTYAPLFYDVPDVTWRINTEGTLNILRHHKFFDRLIFFSTAHVYGEQTQLPITEENPPNPQEPYSVGKVAAEGLIKTYHDAFKDFDYVILRPFNNFGPRQNYKFVVPSFIRQALEGKITVRGDSRRDLVYVKSTVEAVRLLLEKRRPLHNLYNIATGISISMSALASCIADKVGGAEVVVENNPNRLTDISELKGSYSRINHDLGWTPSYSLWNGLGETVAHYQQRWTQGEHNSSVDPMVSTA